MASTSFLKRQAPSKDHQLAAIFVHAGAGFHSIQNEHVHLNACADATKLAMACLKQGGSALDAVELAIKSLEDNEVTNAGYGSNLTAEGNVEGDATIVDHFGRSGAVGAIGKVSNPIHVARQVYERSTQPMALRRVPPNLLVGPGATEFAHESGISVLPNECLVSYGAKDRFKKWQRDIRVAEGIDSPSTIQDSPAEDEFEHELDEEEENLVKKFGPAASHNPTTAALANESQPFSPTEAHDDVAELFPSPESTPTGRNKLRRRSISRTSAANGHVDSTFGNGTLPAVPPFSFASKPSYGSSSLGNDPTDLFNLDSTYIKDEFGIMEDSDFGGLAAPNHVRPKLQPVSRACRKPDAEDKEDRITDTVGAIAVDSNGNIAAASSSGGIGMKHSGRVGPAALVGIGTAVIPIDPADKECTTVACVTSGTGEHMATSLAASTCAQRLYSCTKVDSRGSLVSCDDEEAMNSFVKKDFMGHPSVRNSTTGGAIGTMAVKKDCDGLWLYFAHNTNSFALASMHAWDSEPHTVMSRSEKQGLIVSGGRSMRPGPVQTKSAPLPRSPKAKRSRSNRQNIEDSRAG